MMHVDGLLHCIPAHLHEKQMYLVNSPAQNLHEHPKTERLESIEKLHEIEPANLFLRAVSMAAQKY